MRSDTRAAVIAAADRIDPELGAFITVDVDGALRAAADAPDGRLSGLVIAVKDLIDIAGTRTTYGSRLYADHVPTTTAPVVQALRAQGAVVLGKTNLNEFAFGVTGYNPHYGAVLVPGDRTRTAGGSSGGSAAAVAAGVCSLAVGTDTSGSVRIPAACCGVWGLKCAYGADLRGIHPLAPSYDSIGYLAAGPRELRRVLGITELPDPADLRIGVAGVEVEPPPLPPEHMMLFSHEAWQVHGRRFTETPDAFGADVQLKLSRRPRSDEPAVVRVEQAWRARYVRAVAGYDVVVHPVIDGDAPLLADALADYERDGTTVTDRLLRHTAVANTLGWPALAFPTADGPRQVLGPPGSEPALLTAATELSRRD